MPETVQGAGEAQDFRVSEGSRDLGVLVHEGAVIAPCPRRGNSEVNKRTPGDVQPSLHASGDQVHGDLGAGSHVVFRQNFWATRGERASAGFASFGRLRLANLKNLANSMVRKRAPLPVRRKVDEMSLSLVEMFLKPMIPAFQGVI